MGWKSNSLNKPSNVSILQLYQETEQFPVKIYFSQSNEHLVVFTGMTAPQEWHFEEWNIFYRSSFITVTVWFLLHCTVYTEACSLPSCNQHWLTLSKWLKEARNSFICSWLIPLASRVRIWFSTSLMVLAIVVSNCSQPTRICWKKEDRTINKLKSSSSASEANGSNVLLVPN